jgi:heme oxygenase
MSIAQKMREASAEDHAKAETMHFVTHLMDGGLSKSAYVTYLNQLAFVYQALERKLPSQAELPFSNKVLRFDSIISDLEAFGVLDWAETPMLRETVLYVARLNELSGIEDIRLLAHHYTRYLGDLSGGQAISALIKRHYEITSEQTSFYDFAEIENIVRFKAAYREALDALELTDSELSVLLEEVQLAFKLNQGLFEGLGNLELTA